MDSAMRHWGRGHGPLRVQLVRAARSDGAGFDFTAAMRELCCDIVRRSNDFAAIDMNAVIVSAAIGRNRSLYGLQARVTPMRFRDGARTTRRRGALYGLQRYFVEGREVLYLLTFVLP